MTLLATPPPQSFEIELPELTLSVPDMSKPAWHGHYHTGVLTIYKAEVSGAAVIPNSITVVAIFNEPGGPEFLTYGCYIAAMSVEDIVEHVQIVVYNTYQEHVGKTRVLTAGNNTLH